MGHQILEGDLVHAQRRGEHARPDVREVEALEQALHGSVLTIGSMQGGEHYVDPVQTTPQGDGQLGAIASPDPVAPHLDLNRNVAGLLEAGAHGLGRRQGDIVLGGTTAAEHGNAERGHVVDELLVVVVVDDVVGVLVVVVVGGGWGGGRK